MNRIKALKKRVKVLLEENEKASNYLEILKLKLVKQCEDNGFDLVEINPNWVKYKARKNRLVLVKEEV